MPGDGSQPARVEVGEIDERRTFQWRRGGEIDVVADEYGRPRPPFLPQPAAAVGENDGPAACPGGGPDRVNDLPHTLALVEVGASSEEQCSTVAVTDTDRPDHTDVAFHSRRWEARYLCLRHFGQGLAE